MIVIGLTGGIASGKSTVGRMLAGAGIPVVDADLLAREAVAPGSDGLAAVRARFGDDVIAADGALDRKKLAALVFHDGTARADLNAIVHPRVAMLALQRLATLREAGHAFAVYEVPLLFENNLDKLMGLKTLLVAVPPDVQLARLMARDNAGEADARARIASQMSLEEKRTRADVVLDNSGSPEETARRLSEAWRAVTGEQRTFSPPR